MHTQLLAEASQGAIQLQRKVFYMLSHHSMVLMKTIGRAGAMCCLWKPGGRTARAGGLRTRQARSPVAHPYPVKARGIFESVWNAAEPLTKVGQAPSTLSSSLPPTCMPPYEGIWTLAPSWNPTSRNVLLVFLLESHEQECSRGFPVGILRAGMFSWVSCWNSMKKAFILPASCP